MQTLSQLLDRINSIIWGNWLLLVLLGIGLLYTHSQRFHSGPSFRIHHAEDAAGAMEAEKGGH